MVFLSHIVTEFERLNALFQSKNVDPEKLMKDLDLHYMALHTRVCDNNGNKIALSQVGFGPKFLSEADKLTRKHAGDSDFQSRLASMKIKCHGMLLEAVEQVKRRLPSNKRLFQGLCGFTPSRVLSQTQRVPFRQLPFQHLFRNKEFLVESQYRKILLHIWLEDEVFSDGVPSEAVPFWKGILGYTDSSNTQPLHGTCTLCIVLPVHAH